MSNAPPVVRIFISSPGDVADEREQARRVVAELERVYTGATLQTVLWEDLALPATASFQESIDCLLHQKPIDVAVFILWSRLGTPLGAAVTRPDGTHYRSGTEREFDLMLAAFEQTGKQRPVILAYRREDHAGYLRQLEASPNRFDELVAQRKLTESFVREQFFDVDGRNVRALHSYHEPVSFAQRLRTHLRPVLDELLGHDAAPRWTGEPYRGLSAFDVAHAPIFYGRDEETCDVLERLREQQRAGCAFVVIVGASGAGKSSLARAGVAATLAGHSFDDAGQWRIATLVPGLGEGTPCARLARVLTETLPELVASGTPLDDVAAGLARDPELTIKLGLVPVFARAADAARGPVRLLVVVDQMEELWTDRRITADDRARFMAALEALARCGQFAVLATLRSDFYQHAQQEPGFLRMKGEQGQYDLLPPGTTALARLITEPARLASLRFEREVLDQRTGRTGRTLDEVILEDAARDPSALPLLEYALGELYRASDPTTRQLTFAAYHAMGGVEGALGTRAAAVFASLSADARATLDEVLPQLVTVEVTGDESAARRRAPLSGLTSTPARKLLVESLIAARFLTSDRQDDVPVVCLAHEALLRRWPQLTKWATANREQLRRRTRVEQAQQYWEQQQRDPTLLLPAGLPLEEARRLLQEAENLLHPETAAYIRASITHDESQQTHTRRRRRAVMAAMSGLTMIAVVGGLFAFNQQQEAEKQKNAAHEQSTRALAGEKQAEANEKVSIARLARSNYFLADARWNEHRVADARRHLDSVAPDHRNIEWYLARRKYRGSDVTLYGHMGWVRSVAFSPDGSRIASGSHDKTIKVWDTRTDEELRTLTGHGGLVDSVAFSPDGFRIASGSTDRTIKLWDAGTGEVYRTLSGHKDYVLSVAFSPDGSLLASGSSDNTIKVWDVRSGEELRTLTGHVGSVYGVIFSPDGTRLATGSGDHTIKVWDTRTGEELRTLSTVVYGVTSVAFSPDGSRLASGRDDNTIKVWDLQTGEELRTLTGHDDRVYSVAISPDGTRIASGSGDRTIKVWDARSGEELYMLTGHGDGVRSVVFSADGSRIASGSHDNTIKVWDARTGEEVRTFTGHSEWVDTVAFSPDGSRLASGSRNGRIKVWDARTGEELRTLDGHGGNVESVTFSRDGARLASASDDKTIKLWESQTGEELRTFTGHSENVNTVAFSPDGSRIASGSQDYSIKVWDTRTGEELRTITGHANSVTGVAFSPDGPQIASGSWDGTIKIWDARTGEALRTLAGDDRGVNCVAFSADGSLIASGGFDDTIKIWDARTGAELRTIAGHLDPVYSVAFSPDGSRIASGSQDKTTKVWDPRTGEELCSLTGNDLGVTSVTFSPDGSRLASGSGAGRIKVWDTRIDEELRTLTGHANVVRSVAFSADASRIASASDDKTIKVWDARSGEELLTLTGHAEEVLGVAFSADGTRLYSKDFFDKRLAWNLDTGERIAAPEPWPDLNLLSNRTADGRWLVVPSGKHVLLIDRKFKNTPEERVYRGFKAKLDAWWHRRQIDLTEYPAHPDRYSALFHWAWIVKAQPDDFTAREWLHTEYEKYCDEFKARIAAAPPPDDKEKSATPVSTNPDDYLAPVVLEMLKKYPAPKPSK